MEALENLIGCTVSTTFHPDGSWSVKCEKNGITLFDGNHDEFRKLYPIENPFNFWGNAKD